MDTKKSIKELVAETLASSNEQVKKRVVEQLAEQTIAKRVEIMLKANTLKEQLEGEVKKLSSFDNKQFDQNGQVVSQTYSEARHKELTKARERLTQCIAAMDEALGDSANYQKIASLVSGPAKGTDGQ